MNRAMANSPAALEGYLRLSGALGKGTLPARFREQITLHVFTNYFNRLAETDLDFPAVPA